MAARFREHIQSRICTAGNRAANLRVVSAVGYAEEAYQQREFQYMRTGTARILLVLTVLGAALLCVGVRSSHAQAPFHVVEATIDDVHRAFKSGGLTARQLVQMSLFTEAITDPGWNRGLTEYARAA